ncbi:MAG: DUF4270 domain-containing protein [Taibaiella sp.]|nr:DUF4270 domain-containing protein [Taibaiella sp.]
MKSKLVPIKKAFALCFGFFALINFYSCREKNPGATDLVPGVDNINTFEMTDVDLDAQTKVRMLDSLWTSDPTVPVGVIGILNNDPFFGNISTGLYLQFTVPESGYALPDSISSFDSVVLVLPYSKYFYGDTTGKFAANVYEIEDAEFRVDTSSRKYYAFSTLPVSGAPIGSYAGDAKDWATDSVIYPGSDTLTNQLRIKLDAATLAKFAGMTDADLHNNASFLNFFNGVFVQPDWSSGPEYAKALYYFILSGGVSGFLDDARLELYFSLESSGSSQGMVSFPYNTKYSAFFNHIDKEYTGFPAAPYASTGVEMDSLLVTGGPGFQTDIVLSHLDQIPAQSMVHLARLELNVKKEAFSKVFSHPNLLIMSVVNSDGSSVTLADYQIVAAGDASYQLLQANQAKEFVGGFPIDKLIDNEEYDTYVLNFPREVQKAILEGKNQLTLRLYPYYQLPGAYRLIARGFELGGNAKAKINIIYTKP